MKKVITVLMLCLFTGALSAVESGAAAPAFSLMDSMGKTHSLDQYKGKIVVIESVNFQCPFVKKHYDSNNMQSLQKKYTGKDVVWLTVCSSAKGKPGHMANEAINKVFKAKGMASSAYLIDANGVVGKAYGAKTTPHMFIIDAKGKLAYQGAIDSVKSTKASDIKGATNYVSQGLDELLAGKSVSAPKTKAYGCGVKY